MRLSHSLPLLAIANTAAFSGSIKCTLCQADCGTGQRLLRSCQLYIWGLSLPQQYPRPRLPLLATLRKKNIICFLWCRCTFRALKFEERLAMKKVVGLRELRKWGSAWSLSVGDIYHLGISCFACYVFYCLSHFI
jgi:hypothetical protein